MTLIHSTKTPEQEASFEFGHHKRKKSDIKTHHNPKNEQQPKSNQSVAIAACIQFSLLPWFLHLQKLTETDVVITSGNSLLLPGLLLGVAVVALVLPVLLLLLLVVVLFVVVMLVGVRVLQLPAGPSAADLVVELAEHPDVAFLRQAELQPRYGRGRVAGEHGREPDVPAHAPRAAAGQLDPGGQANPLHEAADAPAVGAGGVHEAGLREPRGGRRRPPHVVVVVRPAGERGGGRGERGRDGGERGRRYGPRAGGGDDGRLGLLQQPLDGLAVGLVAELARELEDPRGAERRHPDPAPPAVHLGVAVLVGAPLRPQRLHPPVPRRRRRHNHLVLLLLLLLPPAPAPILLLLMHLDLQLVLRRLLLMLLLRVVVLLAIQLLGGRGGGGGGGGGGRRRGGGLRFV